MGVHHTMLVRHALSMATRPGSVLPAKALTKLAATGAIFGPACDAIHNQVRGI